MDGNNQYLKKRDSPRRMEDLSVQEDEDVFIATEVISAPISERLSAAATTMVLQRNQMRRNIEYIAGRKVPKFFIIRHGTSACLILQLLCFLFLFFLMIFVVEKKHADMGKAFGFGFISFPVAVVAAAGAHHYFKLKKMQTVYNIFTGVVSTTIITCVCMYFGNVRGMDNELLFVLSGGAVEAVQSCNTSVEPKIHWFTIPSMDLPNWKVPCVSPGPPVIGKNVFAYTKRDTAFCVAPITYQDRPCSHIFAVCMTPARPNPCSAEALIAAPCQWGLPPLEEFFLNEATEFDDAEVEFSKALELAGIFDRGTQLVWRGRERSYFLRLDTQFQREVKWGSFLVFVFFVVILVAEDLFAKWIWPNKKLHDIDRWQQYMHDQPGGEMEVPQQEVPQPL